MASSSASESLEAVTWAPAKVNLYLRILGRRTDGYHLLDSLVVPISLHDELLLRVEPPSSSRKASITVTADNGDVPDGPANLAHKAASEFLAAIGWKPSVEIRIRKHIPPGSGLGGGSSDAAAVLLVLNRLLGRRLRPEEVMRLAGRIGADVPFFVCGHPARVSGIGEEITPVALPTALPLVVCSDGSVLSTGRVYSQLDISLTTAAPATNIAAFISGRQPISDLLVNDLETAAAQIHPEVLSLKSKLVEQGALGALMTGSGSAVFGVWPDLQSAQRAASRLRARGLWAESVSTMETSPAVGN